MNKTKRILELFDLLCATGNALYKKLGSWKLVSETYERQQIREEIAKTKNA